MSSINGLSQPDASESSKADPEALILSADPLHPANLIPSLCSHFYTLGWVTGTGGGTSMRLNSKTAHRHRSPSATETQNDDPRDLIYIAPSGVQKERMQPRDLFVMTMPDRQYLRKPPVLSPSACTPLFLAAYEKRNAGCCIHTHSQWAVLVTLLVQQSSPTGGTGEKNWPHGVFAIEKLEQIKGIGKGPGKAGSLGYFDTLRIPIIENTAREEDLTGSLEEAMEAFPDTYAVLVRRHGIYVWGDDWHKAKTMCESLDYIFQLAVEMKKLGLPWTESQT